MTELIKITSSGKIPQNYTHTLIYHAGQMLDVPPDNSHIGKNGKIKAQWYYVYLMNFVNPQIFKNEFNNLHYTSNDKTIDALLKYINTTGIMSKCTGQNQQFQQTTPQVINQNPNSFPQFVQQQNQFQPTTMPQFVQPQNQFQPTTMPQFVQPQNPNSFPQVIQPQNQFQPFNGQIQQPKHSPVKSGPHTPVFQDDSPSKHTPKKQNTKSPQKQNQNQPFIQPIQSNIISPISEITIKCSTGTYTYKTPIDKNILNEIIRNIKTN